MGGRRFRAGKGARHWVCFVDFRGFLIEQIRSKVVVSLLTAKQATNAGELTARAVGSEPILVDIFGHSAPLTLGFHNRGGK